VFPKIMLTSKGNKFPPTAQGTHVAILTTVVDVGLQESRYGSQPKREIYLAFEVTDEFNEWTDKNGPRREPKRVSTTVTASLSPKAKLREYVEGILGSRLSEAEVREFDIVNLVLGKPCLLAVVHNESNGNTYANIASIAPLPKTMSAPVAQGDLVAYSPEAHDGAVWETLPKFLQEKIAKRVVEEVPPPAPAGKDADFDDEIPF